MQIKTRLTLQFLLSGAIIMAVASFAIFFSSAEFRKNDFRNQLRNKSLNIANMLFKEYEVDANRVRRLEQESPEYLQDEKIIILNSKNDIIFSSSENSHLEIEKSILDRIRLGNKVSYTHNLFEVTGALYFTNYDQFVIIAAAIDRDGLLHLEKLKIILAFVGFTSLCLFFVVGWFASGSAIKPISDVVSKVEDISITSLNLRIIEGKGTDEIGRLAKTFNKMLERLEGSFAMQKNFIANASHELRTPLTSINGQLEVLMMKDRSKAEYKSALASILDDIKSLIDLSNRLLLIARSSAEGPIHLNKKTRIDEILWQVKEETERLFAGYRVNIFMDESLTDSDQMVVIGDESFLKVAVSNLIDNACKYSSNHSADIRFHHSWKNIEVIFEDRGIGIPEEDLPKVFEPFYRSVNTLSISGYGIGLPLANQIIKNHNGTISISSRVGQGTIVTLSLPAIS